MATSVIKTTVRKTSAPAGVKTKTTKPARAAAPVRPSWDTLELVLADQIMTGILEFYKYPDELTKGLPDAITEGYEYAASVIELRRKYLADHVTLK